MEKKILKSNNSVKLSKKDDFAELSDVLKTSEVKKMMRIFGNGDDDFVQKIGGAAVKIVEKMINGKIVAEEKECVFDCDLVNNLHAKIAIPDQPVLKVKNVFYNDDDITKDVSIVEKHGQTFVMIPFFSTNAKRKVRIRYVVGRRKSDVGDNIKAASMLIFKSLFEGKDLKNDALLMLKMLLADEINYNL